MMKNRPGPFTPVQLPARRMTNFSQTLAIFSDSGDDGGQQNERRGQGRVNKLAKERARNQQDDDKEQGDRIHAADSGARGSRRDQP